MAHISERRLWARFVVLLAIAMAAIYLVPSQARAEYRLEAIAGQCQQKAIGNGIWYQDAYPHSLDLTSGCAQVGVSVVTGTLGAWAYGWRFAYVDLGTMRFDSQFAMRGDEQHLVPAGS